QIGQSVRTAEAVGEGRRVRIAVTGLVKRQHDVAAACELDRKSILGLARIDVAVHGEYPRRRLLGGRRRRSGDEAAHGVALGPIEADTGDLDATVGLCQPGNDAAEHDEYDAKCGEPPLASHVSLPLCRWRGRQIFRFLDWNGTRTLERTQ